ncbi:malto-oligosyltrehalose trehalohydrolase [Propionivibrio soli]|uniref:malto-oligosyltrehalose trehalohydrolase n=1 Tax=Propionivibrio soli TaxID=2976531 RepID=UPI0021E835E7|nr:malto-oligosyltrehalose trehalohydrolase [Propionivibrio soli]
MRGHEIPVEHRIERRYAVGAEPQPGGGVHFRVWAPKRQRVWVVLESLAGAPTEKELARDADGYFNGLVTEAGPGTFYRFRLDDLDSRPDPASRYQPEGPHGPSQVVDPLAFPWSDGAWPGLPLTGQVVYEMHVGTFTRVGTWQAALEQLSPLAELGVTAVEVMPVAEFPGRFGWGYDGVGYFAPFHAYGAPDDFRRFVDTAHSLGIGILLDVVYNHFGPDGCYLRDYADVYYCGRHHSDWGDTPCFDGPNSQPVREFFLANAAYWIDEFHLDGLRLDATQAIYDDSKPHILEEIGNRVRAAARGRRTIVVNENEPQHAQLVRPPAAGGYGLDMMWNDDWHHAAMVTLTGQDEAYFTDYRGSAQEFVSAAKYGFLYQGQWYRWQYQRRGRPAFDLEPARFVHFLANHDQVANAAGGRRPHELASPGRWRALTALLLLGPQTPMLFQGQEFSASAPFLFFADHHPELARIVDKGRRESLAEFPNLALPEMTALIAPPSEPTTFERCKLDHGERVLPGHREIWQLHKDLLHLRREDACFSAQRQGGVDGAVLDANAFVLRFFGEDGNDRLLIVNLGPTLHLDPSPEPLLAPPADSCWHVAWSSQDPAYGGVGTLPPEAAEANRRVPNRDAPRPRENWRVQGETALVLIPQPIGKEDHD